MTRSYKSFSIVLVLLVVLCLLYFLRNPGQNSELHPGELSPAPFGTSFEKKGAPGIEGLERHQNPLQTSPGEASKTPLPKRSPESHGIGKRGPRPPSAILFPDGTWLLPLNGVKKAPPFPGFPAGRPYAPVVSIFRDPRSGLSWYLHSDGSRSNVQMVRREEKGKTWFEAGWVVGTPAPVKKHPSEQQKEGGQTASSKAGSSSGRK